MTPRLRPCDDPDCRICRHNVPGEPPDSGHVAEGDELASALLGVAAIVLLFIVAFLLIPVLVP